MQGLSQTTVKKKKKKIIHDKYIYKNLFNLLFSVLFYEHFLRDYYGIIVMYNNSNSILSKNWSDFN